MTSLFPHPQFAEDQPLSHAILYLHVSRAAAMAGSFIGVAAAPTSLLVSRYRHQTPFNFSTLAPRLLKHSGRGLAIGAVAGGLMTYGRMMGKEEVEWQDRSWRLLENKGEMDTDWWTVDSAAIGAVAGLIAARRGAIPMGAGAAVLGGAGLGMATGVGYMISTFARGRAPS